MRRHSSVGAPSIGPSSITPALLTSTSSRPSSSFVRRTNALACASSETSVVMASAVPPASRIRSASASMRSARRAASETAAPASAQASAVASPMPEDAPVTATTRPERSMSIRLPYDRKIGVRHPSGARKMPHPDRAWCGCPYPSAGTARTMGWVSAMANALAGASAGWLALGVVLHLANQAARGRGWYAVVRAAGPGDPGLRGRHAVLAWVAGAGAGGVVSARGGDVVRVLLLKRRLDGTGGSLLTGTIVAEAAGDAFVGVAVIGLAAALGAAPHSGLPGAETLAIAAGVLALLALAGVLVRRRGGRVRAVAAGVGRGCSPLAHPRAFACSVLPWRVASRARRAGAIGCFLLALGRRAGVPAVLLVMLAQSGGRLLPLAPASAAASVAMLAAGFG